MVPTFIFPNQDGFLPNGGEAANQIEAQRKRVRFGEEEQGSRADFAKNSPACGGEAANQIEAQRKRVRFGEEEQGSGRSFRR